jgi:FdhE protein
MKAVQRRLRAVMDDSPDLKETARLYGMILPLVHDADLHVTPVSISPKEARTKIEKGLPLLYDVELELDILAVRELMIRLAQAVETSRMRGQMVRLPGAPASSEPDAATAQQVRLALENDALKVGDLIPKVAAGEKDVVTSETQRLQLDADLVWMLAQSAIKPALYMLCRQLTPLVAGIPWRRGICYVCGADATLGELRDNNLAKHLRCGRCGADWLYRRLQCMYCGNEDHRTLGYLYDESQHDRMRVEVCDACKGYLKVITTFSATPPEMLPVEDLATLHLDFIAQQHGYVRAAAP